MRALELRHCASTDSFALRLRASREHARLTQAELASAARITGRRLMALEMGGSAPPAPELITALASLVGVPALWLGAGDLAPAKYRPAWYVGGGA